MSISISTSSLLLPSQFSPKRSSRASRRTTTLAIRREAHDQNYNSNDSSRVDENLIVLRKRIHEMEMIEKNYEPPTEWMDWEKSLYIDYDSNICELMGLLQAQLMDTRPSLVLGMVGLIALCVPTSTVVVLFHLLELAKGILANGLHIP
ncbi:hypothetical protein KY290_020384 [Solanum tuberosum]|uniref:Uncharacterized protein n=1 Tax=Solanum tuberosum TaxID=4113 RepID=A0ABQ7V0J8_SOLTU|nr:hypothetical protein KY289_019530 [Solanum tuberosum]KAH0756891.1 hypothetical protein KY290_020384 [Solanum tuberosum]